MDNVETDNVEVESSSGGNSLNLRDSLQKAFDKHEEDIAVHDQTSEENSTEALTEEESQNTDQATNQETAPVEEAAQEVAPLIPPADMNASEKEAFLNPTPKNAHVLQQYMNRRAYETRADYSRKMAEAEEMRKNAASMYDVIKQYETDYAKLGISLGDVAKRSIAWDRAMESNPAQTAVEWLESYGLTPQDLLNNQPQVPQEQGNYLTKEQAERIAEERMQSLLKQQEEKSVAYYNQKVVESFMNSKPVFRDPETASQIEADMVPIVEALKNTGRYSSPDQILETAYNYVINGNPAYSSLLSKMTAKPVIQEQKAAVAKAKAASRSISGSPGSGTPKIEAKNLRDNLRRRLSGD